MGEHRVLMNTLLEEIAGVRGTDKMQKIRTLVGGVTQGTPVPDERMVDVISACRLELAGGGEAVKATITAAVLFYCMSEMAKVGEAQVAGRSPQKAQAEAITNIRGALARHGIGFSLS